MSGIFSCSVCQSPLIKEQSRYVCPHNHAFDVAREGYVNLLLANQKRSQEPGDSAEMIRNRRLFLDGGYYDPLRDKLVEIVHKCLHKSAGTVLDVGCGEGFYIGAVQQGIHSDEAECYGIDISKAAIRLAARRYRDVTFAVAGMKPLPVGDQRVDCLLSVFAPRSFSEFFRVLNPGGTLVMVTPGPEHLWGLKRLLYDEPQLHMNDTLLPDGFELAEEISLRYEIKLHSREAISQLLSMTPYTWHIPQTTLEAVRLRDNLKTAVNFSISVYTKGSLS